MECMDMEMNDEVGGNMGSSSSMKNSIHLWYLHEGTGIKTATLEEVDFQQFSVRSLKELATKDKQESFATSADEIDILYNGTILEEKEGLTLEAMNIKPNSVLHVIKKLGSIKNDELKTEQPPKMSDGMIQELVIALKTMTLNPKFLSTIEKLSDPQTLKNEIFAVVPQIQYDPIGISIIQDVSMIFYLANEESLKALAETRPWVVEAFNFIAASIHQQESTSGSSHRDGASGLSGRMPSGLSSALLSFVRQQQEEEEDEEMRDGNPAGNPGTSQQQITRQHLVAALNSLSGFGLLPGASTSTPPQPATPAQRQNSTPRLTDPLSLFLPGAGALNSNRPRSETNSAPVQPPNSQPLTGELVARAMRDALSQLPEDQRNAQMNAFRNLAMSLSQQQSPSQAQQQPTQPAGNAPPVVTTNQTSTPVDTSRFQEELNQMRELGINDDNLARRALEETGGDLAQAVELIFSGYYSQ